MTVIVGNLPRGTTIDQISVPTRLRERYPFHSDNYPRLRFVTKLYGGEGLTPSTVTLLTGTPGSGKSTLLIQMAQALSYRQDTFVLFNGGEESLYQTKLVCERLFGNNIPSFYVGEDLVVDNTNIDMHFKNRQEAKMNKLKTFLGHMRYLIKQNPGKHPVLMIDSLQSFDDGKYDNGHTNGQTPLRVLKLVNKFCKATFASAIIIGQVTKSGDALGSNKLIHDIDARLHIHVDEEIKSETYGMRIIKCCKNRYGYSGGTHILSMRSDGLIEEGVIA